MNLRTTTLVFVLCSSLCLNSKLVKAQAAGELEQAQTILAGYIAKYPLLAGVTISFGTTTNNYQALSYFGSGRILISTSHTVTLERIIAHEIWHIIDWRDNGVIDWRENIPPANMQDYAVAAAPVAAPNPNGSSRWVGYYVSGAPQSLTPVQALENLGAPKPSVINYFQGQYGFSQEQAANVTNHGATPLVTLEFWDYLKGMNQPSPILAMNNGELDEYLKKYAASAKAFGKEIWLRPFHEMNGNWYPWCGTMNGNSPAAFIQAWRHMYDIFKAAGASNVKFVWAPNVVSVPNTAANAISAYWPGDAYVDRMALDGYNFGTTASSWSSFGKVMSGAYNIVTKLSAKPLFIAETACSSVGGDKAEWIRGMFTSIPVTYPRIRGVVWFNGNKERDWRIESSKSSLLAFIAFSKEFISGIYTPTLSGTNAIITYRFKYFYVKGNLSYSGGPLKYLTVKLYKKSGTKWVYVTSQKTTSAGNYSFKRYAGKSRGTLYYKIVFPAVTNTTGSYKSASRTYRITVK